jgi:hypothetical protein
MPAVVKQWSQGDKSFDLFTFAGRGFVLLLIDLG